MNLKEMKISEIKLGKRILKLKRPLSLKISEEDGVICLENSELNLVGCGNSIEEALEDLYEDFRDLLELYLRESEKNLHPRGRKVKKILEDLLGSEVVRNDPIDHLLRFLETELLSVLHISSKNL